MAILVAGAPPKELLEKYGGYEVMFRNTLAEAMANIPRHKWHPKISLHLQAFNVLEAEFPDIAQLDDGLWDAIIVTGSSASATMENVLWMDVLSKYLQHLVLEHPLVRIIGVGFGHQLIARAFGAKIAQDKDHAEVRTYSTNHAVWRVKVSALSGRHRDPVALRQGDRMGAYSILTN